MKKIKIEKSKLNIITAFINQIITTACGILIPRIMIVAFGSDAYGISVSITQFLSYISLLESGIGSVARAKLYVPLARGDNAEIGKVFYAVKRFFQYVAAAFMIYSIILGLTYHDVAHVSSFSRSYIFCLVLVIGISTLAKYMSGLSKLTLIVADQKLYINNVIVIITTLANTIAIVVLAALKADLIWLKLGSSLIFIIRPLLYSLYVRKHYNLPKVSKERAVLEHKWTGIGQHIAYFIHRNIDIVLLTLFVNTRLVAVYSVYSLVISSVRLITESFSGGMEAAFGEMIAKGQLDKLRQSYRKYKSLLTAATFILFGCTGILIIPFIKLYTKGLTDANYIQPMFALILLMAEAINCLVIPCSGLPVAANRIKQTKWGAYGEAIINIVISCALLRWNPLLGIAIGTLAATVFRGIFYMIYSSKHILHLHIYKLLLHFIVTVVLLNSAIYLGDFLIGKFQIENYFQWILYGAIVFFAISLPTVCVCIKRMKIRILKRGKNDANFDCQ